jgi:hypothetical protein
MEAETGRTSEARPVAELWKNSLDAVISGVKLRKVMQNLQGDRAPHPPQRPTLAKRDSIFDLIQIAVGHIVAVTPQYISLLMSQLDGKATWGYRDRFSLNERSSRMVHG